MDHINKEILQKQADLTASAITEEDLGKIQRYTRRDLKTEEIYDFSMILCDNDVDRDFEMFSVDTLYALKDLYLGKTGIFDHNPKGNNQTARIFETEVIEAPEQKTQSGESYHYLKARAYMVRNDKNKDLILEIDGGIKKEVSVGCSVGSKTCSICGSDITKEPCGHIAGEYYSNRLCYVILSNPTDAYEWSFVAIPAQRQAGVIKKFENIYQNPAAEKNVDKHINSIIRKAAKTSLSKSETNELKAYLDSLKTLSKTGNEYITDLKADVLKLSYLVNGQIECEVMEQVVQKMTLAELKAFKKAYEVKLNREDNNVLQLGHCKDMTKNFTNHEFKI